MWARGFSVRIGGAVFAGHAAAVPATRVTAAAAAAGCQRGGARRYKGASHSRPPPGRGAEARGLQTSDGEPLLNVVFVNPQIAQNLGSFGRTSIGLGAKVRESRAGLCCCTTNMRVINAPVVRTHHPNTCSAAATLVTNPVTA